MATAQLGAVLRHIRSLTPDRETTEQTDGALLRAFLSGNDQAAFGALVRRHGPMAMRVCLRTLGHVHDAEDAFQATFLVLAQQAASIRKRESLASWLHGVAYRMATHAKRAAARRRGHELRASTTQPRDPALSAAWQEIQALLDHEIASLPETLRAPFVYCCLENKGCAEAARLLGIEEGTVWKRLSRARKLLQVRLGRRGVSLTTVLAAAAVATNNAQATAPPILVDSIVRVAAHIAAGRALARGLAPAEVINLVEGVNQAMLLSKCKMVILLLVSAAIVGAGVGLAALRSVGAETRPLAQKAPQEPSSEQSNEAKDIVSVCGRVLYPDGKPFAGAKLYLGDHSRKKSSDAVRATSADDGRFAFTFTSSEADRTYAGDPPYQVMAVAEGHGCDWLPVGPPEEELTLRLVKDLPINARILDPDGRPVAGARLTVTDVTAPQDLGSYLEGFRTGKGYPPTKRWDGPLAGRQAVVTTGDDGRFCLTGAGRERIVGFRLEGPAIASTSLHVMTRAAATDAGGNRRQGWWKFYGASSDYVGLASRPIRGVVRDKETGKPLAGVSVAHYHGQGPETFTDKEGRYELLGLVKSAHYALNVKPADGLYFGRRVQFEDTAGLGALTGDIELVTWLTVRGRVTDKATGKPIAQARVDYHPLGGNPNVNVKLPGSWDPRAVAMTGPDGSYALTVLPGPGVIGVTGPRREAYMPAGVTLKERKTFFKGRLVDDKEEDYLTRAAGAGSFGGISMGDYNTLVLLEPGEKDETLVKNVALELPQQRQGRIVGPDDQPLAGVAVIGLDPYRSTIETLKGAEFTVRGLNPRAKRPLVFIHKDKNLGFFVRELPGDSSAPLTVKLQPCGSASGRVVDQDGLPVAGLRLHVPGRATRSWSGGLSVITDKEGRFRALGLVPEQEYWVWEPGGLPRVFAQVVVEPGKHKDMGDLKMTERNE